MCDGGVMLMMFDGSVMLMFDGSVMLVVCDGSVMLVMCNGGVMLRMCDGIVCAASAEKRESYRAASRLSHQSSRDTSREATVEQWTYNDVVKWLSDHRLAQVTNRSVVC